MLLCSTSKKKLGCNAQLIVDEFGEKLLEELDYLQEARNIQVMLQCLFTASKACSLSHCCALNRPWRCCHDVSYGLETDQITGNSVQGTNIEYKELYLSPSEILL